MAKPFREEDIPSFLDRETGKFKPLFEMPNNEANADEDMVEDADDLSKLQNAVFEAAGPILGLVKIEKDAKPDVYVNIMSEILAKYKEMRRQIETLKEAHKCSCKCKDSTKESVLKKLKNLTKKKSK